MRRFITRRNALGLVYGYNGFLGFGLALAAWRFLTLHGAIAPMGVRSVAWVAVSGLAGGLAAFEVHRRMMSTPGLRGTVKAVGAQMLTALVAAMITGSLIVPGQGTLYAVVVLAQMIGQVPTMLPLWLVEMLLFHMLLVGLERPGMIRQICAWVGGQSAKLRLAFS